MADVVEELVDELGSTARFARAACAGMPTDLWFPLRNQRHQLAKAKGVCSGCPSRVECLTWALAAGEVHGVWGGLSERERRPLRRAAGLVAA